MGCPLGKAAGTLSGDSLRETICGADSRALEAGTSAPWSPHDATISLDTVCGDEAFGVGPISGFFSFFFFFVQSFLSSCSLFLKYVALFLILQVFAIKVVL